jgi:hypothetical protein
VAVAPLLLGDGTEAVGDLGATQVADGLRLLDRTVHHVGPDLVVAGNLDGTLRAKEAHAPPQLPT